MTDQTTDPIPLPARCGLSVARDLKAAAQALPENGKLSLDASEVGRMSAPVVMALISAAGSLGEDGGGVVVRAPTPAFTDAFADLGLFGQLMTLEFTE